jgi:hypothetical protein
VGYILFVVAAFGCSTFQVKATYEDTPEDNFKFKYGYWGEEDDEEIGGCYNFVKEDLDDTLKTGRAIGILGTILGPIAILLLLTTSFLAVPRVATLTLGIVTGLLMPLFCGIMYIGLATKVCTKEKSFFEELETKCVPSAKGYLLIPALLFWIGGSIPLCMCFKERRPRDNKTPPDLESDLRVSAKEQAF